jgi:predicted aspartyl protease
MRCRGLAALAACLLSAYGVVSATAQTPDPCRPVAAETFAIVAGAGGLPLLPLAIDGQSLTALLDTGSFMSLIDPAVAHRLGLALQHSIEPLVAGADGRPLADYVQAHSIRLGGVARGSVLFVVPPRWSVTDARVAAVLGRDVVRGWDVELDLGEGLVRLYPRNRCLGMILPFGGGAETVPIEAMLGHIIVSVRLNGQHLRALLDTGATNSSLPLDTARRLFGIGPGMAGVTRAGAVVTPDGGRLARWQYRFNLLELGRTRLQAPVIDLMNRPSNSHVAADHDLVLGVSELRQLRLYIAYGQNRLAIARGPG